MSDYPGACRRATPQLSLPANGTGILVSSRQSSPALDQWGIHALEDDLDEFLGAAGETTGCGIGCGAWSVDLVLKEGQPVEEWTERLRRFLQQWGVPEDTFLRQSDPDPETGREAPRIRVFPGEAPPGP